MTRARILWCALITVVASICGMAIKSCFFFDNRLNVILITLDTTRADHLGCYGYPAALTPTIDGLARRGVLFERAYTPVPLTLPAHASIHTGLYPFEHSLFTNGHQSLPEKIPTLAEVLASRGYATAAFVAAFVLNRKFGLDRGFEVYDDDVDGARTLEAPGERRRSADQVIDRTLAWLTAYDHKPFFCWLHLFDPHAGYLEHRDTFGNTFQSNAYDAEIAFVDLQLKRLIDFLEAKHLIEKTMIVIVGDHGEGLAEHRERWHGYMLYNSTIQVPLIVSVPSKTQFHSRVADLVSLIDIAPTILDCLDIPCIGPISGRSLKPALSGEAQPSRASYGVAKEVFLEEGWSPLSCLITPEWKYIQTAKPELYDLRNDPEEKLNLAHSQTDKLLELQQQLNDVEASGVRYESQSISLSDRDRENLTGLGYLGGQGPKDTASETRPDIKDMLDDFDALQGALELVNRDESESAIAPLYQLIASSPRYLAPRRLLAELLTARKKTEEAENQYLAILDIVPDDMDAHANLGVLLASQKQYEPALKHLLKALKTEAASPELHFSIAKVLKALDRPREAYIHFQTAENLSQQQKRQWKMPKPR